MKWFQGVVLTVASVAIVADAQVAPRPASRTELMMVTGAESGAYYAMGRLAWGSRSRRVSGRRPCGTTGTPPAPIAT